MPDILDCIQNNMALLEEKQAQLLLESTKTSQGESACKCFCGNEIPEKRRYMLPGVTTYVECQIAKEKSLRCMGGNSERRYSIIYG